MFKKKSIKPKRGLIVMTYHPGEFQVDCIVQILEEAGSQSRVKLESCSCGKANFKADEFRKIMPEWVKTQNITIIGSQLPAERPTNEIGAAAYDLYSMKEKNHYPELLEVISRLVLPVDDRADWSVTTIENALKDLLDNE